MFEELKQWLTERKGEFYQENSWAGDTEGGFFTEKTFDFDALLQQIDEFAKTFKKE